MAHSLHSQQPPESKHGEHNAPRKHTSVNALIGFVLVVIAAIFVMSVLFRVHDIRVEGNEHYTDEEIIKAIDIEDGDNLFFYDRIAAVSRALAKLPYIEEVSITRSLPDRITITVTESKAMAYLVVGDEDWTLDHNCKVLGKAAEGEQDQLIPIVGFDPGTLLIGEQLTTGDGSIASVEYLADRFLLSVDMHRTLYVHLCVNHEKIVGLRLDFIEYLFHRTAFRDRYHGILCIERSD